MLSGTEKRNTLWNSVSFIIISFLGFVNFTLNYSSFSTKIFGLFILINSIFGIGQNVDFGFGISTIKYIAEANKKSDSDLINTIFITFFCVFIIFGLVLVVVFILYYHLFFSKTELFKQEDHSTIFTIYFLLTSGFFFRYLSNYLSRVFEGFSEFIKLSKINICLAFLNTLFILLIFLLKLDIVYLALFLLLKERAQESSLVIFK